jgi:hypothetical protein
MGRFLLKLFLFGITAFAAAWAFEAVLYLQMQDRRAHVHEDWPDLRGLDADFVFVGNSRTAGHVIPKRIEQHGLKGYNIAYDGYTAQMGGYRLEYILDHTDHPPRYVFVQTDLSFIPGDGRMTHYPMKDGVLRYFLLDQIGINKYYRNFANWREADAFLPLLRYKGYPLIFVKHLLGWNRWDRRGEQGFWHKDKEVGFALPPLDSAHREVISLCGLDSICEARGIQLIGVIPPSPQSRYRPSDLALNGLPSGMPVWDLSALFEGDDSLYFYDLAHFSLKGAEIYSDSLSLRFSQLLQSAH